MLGTLCFEPVCIDILRETSKDIIYLYIGYIHGVMWVSAGFARGESRGHSKWKFLFTCTHAFRDLV